MSGVAQIASPGASWTNDPSHTVSLKWEKKFAYCNSEMGLFSWTTISRSLPPLMFAFGHQTKSSSSRYSGQILIQSTIFLFRPYLTPILGTCWCVWTKCIFLSPCILFSSLIFCTCSCYQVQSKLEICKSPKQSILQFPKLWGSKINHFCLQCLYIPLTSAVLYRYAWKFSQHCTKSSIFCLKRLAEFWDELHYSSAEFLLYSYKGRAWSPTPGFIILNCSPVTLVTVKTISWLVFLVTKTHLLLELAENCSSAQEYRDWLSLT